MGEFSVSVLFEDLKNHRDCLISAVNGPHASQRRSDCWSELDAVKARWAGPWCIGGDFNVIKIPEEKLGGCRMTADMRRFSDWINSHGQMDLQLNGALFTWSNQQTPPIMSRLDRYFISTEWADLYPQTVQTALPKPNSDHCPIVLNSRWESWRPKPFRFELIWLEEKGFKELIRSWWSDNQLQGWAGFRLTSKPKSLKANIKDWAKANFGSVEVAMAELLRYIKEIDTKEEYGPLSDSEIVLQQDLKEKFLRKVKEEEIKWRQRTR